MKGSCIIKRMKCRNMDQRFDAEGYSSHNGPEDWGVKGNTMKGRNFQNPNAEATSWRSSPRGELV